MPWYKKYEWLIGNLFSGFCRHIFFYISFYRQIDCRLLYYFSDLLSPSMKMASNPYSITFFSSAWPPVYKRYLENTKWNFILKIYILPFAPRFILAITLRPSSVSTNLKIWKLINSCSYKRSKMQKLNNACKVIYYQTSLPVQFWPKFQLILTPQK